MGVPRPADGDAVRDFTAHRVGPQLALNFAFLVIGPVVAAVLTAGSRGWDDVGVLLVIAVALFGWIPAALSISSVRRLRSRGTWRFTLVNIVVPVTIGLLLGERGSGIAHELGSYGCLAASLALIALFVANTRHGEHGTSALLVLPLLAVIFLVPAVLVERAWLAPIVERLSWEHARGSAIDAGWLLIRYVGLGADVAVIYGIMHRASVFSR